MNVKIYFIHDFVLVEQEKYNILFIATAGKNTNNRSALTKTTMMARLSCILIFGHLVNISDAQLNHNLITGA